MTAFAATASATGALGLLLCALSAVFLLLAAHPFTTYPLSLALLARLRPRRAAPRGPMPATAALCVCAYNEERVIRAKAENMLLMREAVPGLELLIYVDAATDGTAAILQEYADRIRVTVAPARHGKTHGMNGLVASTTAEVVVFSDANVAFAPDAVPALLGAFTEPGVGVVCGHLVYRPAPGATAGTGSLYWRLEERIKALETATGSAMGADGSIFAMRRALHRPPPADLIDDMWVSLRALCGGARIVRCAGAVAYEDSVSQPAEEFRRKVRIACQAFNVHRDLLPLLRGLGGLDRYKYVSHKLLRWLTAYLLAASMLCLLAGVALAAGWMAAAALLVAGATGGAVLHRARRGRLAALRDILSAFLATGLGVWRSLQGRRFQTWNPPASARGPGPGTEPDAGVAA